MLRGVARYVEDEDEVSVGCRGLVISASQGVTDQEMAFCARC